MSRHWPNAAELNELDAAWDAYLEDEADFERLALAINAVMGRRKSAARLALESATMVSLDKIPAGDRSFSVNTE